MSLPQTIQVKNVKLTLVIGDADVEDAYGHATMQSIEVMDEGELICLIIVPKSIDEAALFNIITELSDMSCAALTDFSQSRRAHQ